MSGKSKKHDSKVACTICLKEVPTSEAKSDEASDYVRHFCGLDCYDKWRKKAEATANDNTPNKAKS